VREDYSGRGPNHRDFVVIFNTASNDLERSILTRGFVISANKEKAWIKLITATGDKYDIETQVNGELIAPEGNDMSAAEKILLRFEEAMAGRISRVDLRFCTGPVLNRNPRHDNLHPEYRGPRPA
jgi:hypothetical protein